MTDTDTDYIKAHLELFKLLLTAFMGAFILLFIYRTQYSTLITYEITISYYVTFLAILSLMYAYVKTAKQLKKN